MSVPAVPHSTAAPARSPSAAAASQAPAPATTASASKSQSAVAQVKAASAALQEASETPAQTLKEAASGDRQAQKLLHHGNLGRVVNTKA